MKRTLLAFCVLIFCSILLPGTLVAQSYLYSTGNPSFSVNIPVENGFINIANGNLHLEFPLATQKQRGSLNLDERLVYDSRVWAVVNTGTASWQPSNVPNTPYAQGGWRFVTGAETGTLTYSVKQGPRKLCPPPDRNKYYPTSLYSYRWEDPSGTSHAFDGVYEFDNSEACSSIPFAQPENVTGAATDASGYQITISGDTSTWPPNVSISDSTGIQVYPQVIDRYGNYWSFDSNGNLIDDLGRTPVVVTTNGNVTYYDVLAPNGTINNNGTRVRYTVTTAPISVSTQFGQSGVTEWSGTLNPVQSIQLPDGSSYSFTYDSYGELSSVTLPTGGVIQYGWSNYIDSYQNENRWLTSRTLGSNPAMLLTPAVISQCTSGGTGARRKSRCKSRVGMKRSTNSHSTMERGTLTLRLTTARRLAAPR